MKNPLELLWGPNNNDNLHLIAISQLEDSERRLERWWHKKYRQPPKPHDDYTHEELIVEMLEDYYDDNASEAERFLMSLQPEEVEQMPEEYEAMVQKRYKKFFEKNQVDLSKYQSKKELTPEEEQSILDNLGKSLPKSRMVTQSSPKGEKEEYPLLGGDSGEFEEEF